MKYTVITTFNQSGLETYGQRMIDQFEKLWPQEVELKIYAENCQPLITRPTTEVIDIFAASPSCVLFVEKHRNNPEANGGIGPHNSNYWDLKKSFRWQAVRFCYKVFAVQHAVLNTNSDVVIWLDADSVTHTSIPFDWIGTVCPQGFIASYLGRTDRYHSECGWIGYNIHDPLTRDFVNAVANMYINDEIFNHGEWHDSYIWDVVRKKFRDERGAKFYDLNPEPDTRGLAKHPFINSELGRYIDHFKGDRKKSGHSRLSEMLLHQDSAYWQSIKGKR